MSRALAVVAVSFALAACSEQGSATGNEKGSGSSTASAPTMTTLELAKLGLHIDVPAEFRAKDGLMPGVVDVVNGRGSRFLMIAVSTNPETLDEAKENAAKMSNAAQGAAPTNLTAENLADGWALSYDAGNSIYVAIVQREIGGKTYSCAGTLTNAANAAVALAVCKTLRK